MLRHPGPHAIKWCFCVRWCYSRRQCDRNEMCNSRAISKRSSGITVGKSLHGRHLILFMRGTVVTRTATGCGVRAIRRTDWIGYSRRHASHRGVTRLLLSPWVRARTLILFISSRNFRLIFDICRDIFVQIVNNKVEKSAGCNCNLRVS